MILVVTLLGVLFALVNVLQPLAIAGIVFLIICIAAHVAGNSIGTRLRHLGDLPTNDQDADGTLSRRPPGAVHASDCAPPTQLATRAGLGLPMFIATTVGALGGAAGGGVWGFSVVTGDIGWLNILVGVLAFSVLGGIGSFATFSFGQVLLGALWQAHRSATTHRRQ